MHRKNAIIVTFLSSGMAIASLSFLATGSAAALAQDAAQPAVAKRIGAIKAISGNAITLAADPGPAITVNVQPNARILRLVPGEKDLKNATPIQLQELQVGETIRARGQASDDGKSIAALEIVVITRSAVDAVGDQKRQDWLKRGVAGPVSAVDPAAGTISITTGGFGGKKTIVVRASKTTVVWRYAPDSAKSEDAKLSTLQDVSVGDQLRARGNRSADGSEVAAEEIFTGTFHNFGGLIKSIDATTGTVSLQDLVSKKNVQLKITADSQLHKIPPEMARVIAMRFKAAMPPGVPGSASAASGSSAAGNGQPAPGAPTGGGQGGGGMATGGAPGGGMGAGGRPGGGFDVQRMLDATPAVALADLHKGDAIVVLATQGTPAGGNTVIKLFSGVEPILQAAPVGSQAMMLAPWSLGGAPGGDAGQQ